MMKSFQLKTALHLFLAIAFLSMQWSGAHIHLAEHHEHDGSHHKHSSQLHTHSVAAQHTDSIYTPDTTGHDHSPAHDHSTGHDRIVELAHKCPTPSWKQLADISVVFIPLNYPISESRSTFRSAYVDVTSSHSSWPSYSTIRLRAPPPLAS